MASCSSCGSTPTTVTANLGCGDIGASPPRRSATPPTTPVTLTGLDRVRQATSGKLLLGGCACELQALDWSVDGPVNFDAATGQVYVGSTFAPTAVQDNYPCTDEEITGLFLMGKNPGCREPGQNPDRDIVVVRMTSTNMGEIVGSLEVCSAGNGLAAEMKPVKLQPAPLIRNALEGTSTLILPQTVGFTEESTLDCDNMRRTVKSWFSYDRWQQPNVDDVVDADIVDGVGQNVWFTAWRELTDGVKTTKELVQVSKAQMDRLIGAAVATASVDYGIVHLTPWPTVGYSGYDLSPVQTLFSFNPTALPGYSPEYRTMWLRTRLIASSHGADFQVIIKVGNQEVHNGVVREEPNLSGDFINPTYVFPMQVSAGTISVVKTIGLLGGNTGQVFECDYELKLVGWQR